ncbi:MAG: acetate kinase [Zetaproteobacteria bacterium CG12_big_fil_rev_8_21_14_0_65_54_13]|nr:MAG: acetate kinase [Zetaproteobacteria bacterium CG12_big_fil_rev_8_21_14_0_65_54_13]PIX53506.1 MAG: acetate kinase [Zetaproteobacteria bacterium CG_4_10_14_3_um_filter_54_28]PJA28316.1 MAG: acetate kinase [Zetaproteobacteria bacterium CG_4_9_14_3_um_filter_54_145]
MILIINSGSSSIKMALIDMPSEKLFAEGMAERLGEPGAALGWHVAGETHHVDLQAAEHLTAMEQMLAALFCRMDKERIVAVGHRVVHGGERFIAPTLLDDSVIAGIEALSHLAPLHNPANLLGIRAAIGDLPSIPHVAVFDTAFHHAMPLHASLYAVPYHWYSEYGVRRYGFHGTSHHYVGLEAAAVLGRAFTDLRLLTAHLGNGCSATAIAGGISVDTSMGMTPLEGLVMGTRSGDVDPGLHDFIARESGQSLAEITSVLNRQSGLLGLSGRSNDMRELLAAADEGDERAALAVDMFCYRLAKSLAGLAVALGHIDAIVFTGGIGEHAAVIRAKTVAQLAMLGADLDSTRNNNHGRDSQGYISSSDGALPVLVIATNEEKMIARYVSDITSREEKNR